LTDSRHFPLVTVVTPSFNQGQFIEETILSVLNQDYPKIEYLVIDGGSTDNTLEVLRKYEDRVRWISEFDSGQSHAINKGFRMARGEILCWLNSDDIYEPGAIRAAVEYLVAHPDTMLVYGEGNLISPKGDFLQRFPYTRPFDLWALVYLIDFILQPTTFFRRTVIEEVGFLNENLHWCMDLEYWLRIGSRFKLVYVPHLMASARLYTDTKTSTGGAKRLKEIFFVLRKYGHQSFFLTFVRYVGGSLAMSLQSNAPCLYSYAIPLLTSLKYALRRRLANSQGVYPDDWLGRRARFMFPAMIDSGSIQFSFDMPDDERLHPNRLVACSNGNAVTELTMQRSGGYQLKIPYDPTLTNPTDIELIFSRSLPPDSQRRRLACKLVSVDFVP